MRRLTLCLVAHCGVRCDVVQLGLDTQGVRVAAGPGHAAHRWHCRYGNHASSKRLLRLGGPQRVACLTCAAFCCVCVVAVAVGVGVGVAAAVGVAFELLA
jgi:hypothetical protein